MIRKCIALVIPARLSEEVTARPQDVRHGTLEALYGPLDCIVSGDWQVYLRADSSNLRTNVRATQLLRETGLYLPEVTGNAIYLGRRSPRLGHRRSRTSDPPRREVVRHPPSSGRTRLTAQGGRDPRPPPIPKESEP